MEKYRESIELAERITRYLEGKLSDMEELELEKELQGIPEGEKLLERIRDPKAIVVKKEIYESFDAARSWNEIQKATSTKNSKQIYRVFWYAAILILPLAVAAFFLYVVVTFLRNSSHQYRRASLTACQMVYSVASQ